MIGRAQGAIDIEVDGALRNLDRLQGGISRFDQQAASGTKGWGDAIQENEQHINALGQGLTVLGGAVTGTFGLMVNTAANFEQSMDGVAAAFGGVDTATGITKAQFEALQEEALRIGEDTSKSATEAARAMDLMAKAGLDVEVVLNGAAQAAVNVSEATDESLEQSASTMSTLSLLFEDTGISAQDMGDVIVNAMNMSDASMSEFQTGMARLAPVIKGGSLSANEAAAALVYFNAQGFSAAEVGTSLTSIFQSVSAGTDDMKEALAAAGIEAYDLQGNFIGFPALFDQVARATEGMTEAQKAEFLATAFMTDGHDLLNAVVSNTGDVMRQAEEDIAVTGTAAIASATRMDNLRGSLEQMSGAFETMSIRIGSLLIPIIRPFVDAITRVIELISGLPAPILAVGAAFGIIGGAIALFSGLLLLALPKIADITVALNRLGGVRGVLNAMLGPFRQFGTILGRFGGWSGIFANGIRLIVTALRGLLFANPLLTALGLAFIAFQTNFLGFGDAVRAVASWVVDGIRSIVEWLGRVTGVSQAIDNFRNRWQNLTDTVANNGLTRALLSVEGALRGLGTRLDWGWIDTAADKLRGLGTAINDFFGAFRSQDTTIEATLDVAFDGDEHVIEWQEQEDGSIKYAIMHVDEDGTLTEFGEIIESYDDESDPNIAHIKVRGDDGEFWTTVDKTTGVIGDATIEVGTDTKTLKDTRKWIDRIVDGLNDMEKALRRADMDFLADMVGYAADGAEAIQTLFEQFDQFRQIMDPVEAALMSIGATFPALNRFVLPAVDLWGRLKDAVASAGERLTFARNVFTNLMDAGINPVSAALRTLGAVFPVVSDVTTALAGAVANLGSAWTALRSGDWSRAFDNLQMSAELAWDAIQAGIALLGELAVAVADWVLNVGAPAVIGAAQDIWDRVSEWVQNDAWPTVKATAISVAGAIVSIAGWLVEQGESLYNAVRRKINEWLYGGGVSGGGALAGANAAGGGFPLGDVAVRIGRWLISAAQSIGDAILLFLGYVAAIAIPAAVSISEWLMTNVPPIADAILNFLGHVARISLPVFVTIAGWVQGQIIQPIGEAIAEWVRNPSVTVDRAIASVQSWWVAEPNKDDLRAKIRDAIIGTAVDAVQMTIDGVRWVAKNIDKQKVSQAVLAALGVAAGAALALPAIAAVAPVAVTLGAVIGLIALGIFLAREITNWAIANPVDAIEFTVDVYFFLGDVVNFITGGRGWTEFALSLIGLPRDGFIRVGMNAFIDWVTKLGKFVWDEVTDWVKWARRKLGLPEDGILLVGMQIVIEWIFGQGESASVEEVEENLGGDVDETIRINAGNIQVDAEGYILNAEGARLLGPDGGPVTYQDLVDDSDGIGSKGIRLTEGEFQLDPTRFTWEGLDEIAPFMQQHIGAAGVQGITAAGQSIGAAAGTAFAPVGTSITTAGATWGQTLATGLAGLGAVAASGFGQIPMVSLPPLAATALGVAAQTAAMAVSAGTNFGSIVNAAVTRFPAMQTAATSAASAMNAGVTGSINAMQSASTIAVAGMQTGIALSTLAMRTSATSDAESMRSDVTADARSMSADSAAEVLGMRMGIVASMQFMEVAATRAAQTMGTNVVNAARLMGTGAANAVRNGMNQIPSIIASVGAYAASVARAVGAQIGNGVASGIESALGRVRAAANAIVAEAAGAMAAAALISSPSRLFMRLAAYMPEGVIVAFERSLPDVARASRAMVDAAAAPADSLSRSWDRFMAATAPIGLAGAVPVLAGIGGGGGNSATMYIDIDINGVADPEANGDAVINRLRREYALGGGLFGG